MLENENRRKKLMFSPFILLDPYKLPCVINKVVVDVMGERRS